MISKSIKKLNLKLLFNSCSQFQGRVARAVSLCLFNKIHVAQLYWPETSGITRHSVSHLDDHHRSPSMVLPRVSYQKSDDIEEVQEQSSKLLQTPPEIDTEPVYDGLIALDEIRLNRMVETDIISPNG